MSWENVSVGHGEENSKCTEPLEGDSTYLVHRRGLSHYFHLLKKSEMYYLSYDWKSAASRTAISMLRILILITVMAAKAVLQKFKIKCWKRCSFELSAFEVNNSYPPHPLYAFYGSHMIWYPLLQGTNRTNCTQLSKCSLVFISFTVPRGISYK